MSDSRREGRRRRGFRWSAILVLAVLVAPADAGEQEVLARLRAATTYDDEAIGVAGAKSETYRAYEELRKTASARRLVALTDDRNAVVRCYAFRALAEKHTDFDLFPVLWRHLDDFHEVKTFRGCIVSGEKVGDVMIDTARARLTEKQQRRILERIVRAPSQLAERPRLLRSATVPAELLPELRRLVDDGDEDALVAIARHRREEDMARIEKRLRAPDRALHPELIRALDSAALHRHPRLLPALEALAPRARVELRKKQPERLRSYFRALAAQPSPRAAKLLASFLDLEARSADAKRQMGAVLLAAAGTSPTALHAPLFWRLWKERGLLNAPAAQMLYRLDSERARATIARDLRTNPNRMPPDATRALLELWAKTDRDATMSLVTTALPHADVSHFASLAQLAGRFKANAPVDALLDAYRKRENPHVYLAAAKALLAYDRPDLDVRLDAAAREIDHLKMGWGGKALRKLLAAKPRDGD